MYVDFRAHNCHKNHEIIVNVYDFRVNMFQNRFVHANETFWGSVRKSPATWEETHTKAICNVS